MMSNGGYNLAEIWQYPVSESGVRRGQFGRGLGQFENPNREVSSNGPVSLAQQHREGGVRRRLDEEDEAAKVVSTSNGHAMVIGKALVLDEIINYIQSLQHQFLSMKLETVNSRMNPAIEVFHPKDYGQQTLGATGMAFGSQATREFSRVTSPEWLHIGGDFERTT